jgi:hypothetical protein
MVAFIVGLFTIFFFFLSLEFLLIEKGVLVEFSDRMANILLMAAAITVKTQEQFLSRVCDLCAVTLLSIQFSMNSSDFL